MMGREDRLDNSPECRVSRSTPERAMIFEDAKMTTDRTARALARSSMYALLAEGFRIPDEDSHTRYADATYSLDILDALHDCAPELAGRFKAVIAPNLIVTSTLLDLEAAYLSAFETDIPAPSVSLYEGTYHQQNERPALLLELKGFYGTFGLEMSTSTNDVEDTLTAELEFMQFLAAKQAQAEQESLSPTSYLKAQRDFLDRHLAAWLPALRAESAAKVGHPFYVALAELAAEFVAQDLEGVCRDTTGSVT